ncbi:neprilysin [Chloropicon primus]|uniref:Neprilysin n=1 Tax=Chloropicon primus TaxID=1764295 RepID=A0A5B8MMH4_9CHLO|nr:neprilysin [Chloropicon primus]UPR01068.1 neprilysin [Chloropicon primus]|mmetsp:Transcript_8905/g.25422  ORF Transcript_8905/g.25422 Transcript_8905/m.25422 type:complete len:788 (+) Transcript_8905:163-2526(+)|eukprot:QDZ21848.1 neprilysin [Chloropicon primus]
MDLSSSCDSQRELVVRGEARAEGSRAAKPSTSRYGSPTGRPGAARHLVLLVGALISVLLVTLGILSFEIHTLKRPSSAGELPGVCVAKECTVAAAQMLDSMDMDADPCRDFFRYACGNFNDRYYLPEGQNQVSQFTLAGQVNDMMILQALDGNSSGGASSEEASDALAKARKYYDQCMDLREMNRLGISPVLDLLAIPDFLLKFGAEVGQTHNFTRRELVFGALRELQQRHVRILVDFWVGQDRYNSSEIQVHVRQGLLGLPDSSYYETGRHEEGSRSGSKHARILQAYKNLLWEGLRLLESRTVKKFDEEGSADEIESLVAFESRIAGCHMPKESLNQPILTHNPMEVEAAEIVFPFGWRKFIQNMSGPANYTGKINIETPSALSCMTRVMDETPIEDMALYMKVMILLHRGELLDNAIREWRYKFNLQTTGVSGAGPRWRQCMDLVTSHQRYGFALTKPYVQRAFGRESKEEVEDIFEKVEEAFLDQLPSVEWLGEKTRKVAAKKARAMKKHLGYPDWVMDDEKVAKFYENVSVDGTFFENTVSLFKAHQDRVFARLFPNASEPMVDPEDLWILSPTEINAYYSVFSNTIAFPAGVLHPPFFTQGAPMPLNYGSLGTFVAHEFTHAFDSNGRKFDENGEGLDWWTDKDDEHFEERAKCFVDQYSKFELYGHRNNGNLTLPENLADNAGMQLAFRAFTKELETSKTNRLPSTPFTPHQLFFLGFAQSWCSNIKEDKALMSMKADPHSLPQFRVNGVVSNSVEFSKAFQCKPSSPLNPARKCNLWLG